VITHFYNCVLTRTRLPLALLVGIIAFAGSAAIGLLQGIPAPNFQDEFSYLLAADTFSHGRFTNPTHPMWIHFESMHIIQQPTYMSKYPPAQGLVLAVGQILTGYPIVGVWVSVGFMCSAVFWMLRTYMPRQWALLGGLLAIIHPELGIAGYWAQSYWGGAVAATGGALVLGGLRSLIHKPRVTAALILGIGLAILANSRPFEGLLLSLPVAMALLCWLVSKNGPPVRLYIKKILLPLILVMGMTAAGMALYNFRITGNVFRFPYQVHEQTYGSVPVFIWQDLPPSPQYHHPLMKEFHLNYGRAMYNEKQTFSGFVKISFAALAMYTLLAGSVYLVPIVAAARDLIFDIWNDPWTLFAFLTYVFCILGMMFETYHNLHYFAPIVSLNFFFILLSLRLLWLRNPRVGKPVLCAVPLLAIAVLSINIRQSLTHRDELAPQFQRARLLAKLQQDSKQHVVLVRYGPNHIFEHEWVYNEADIDAAKVVWARDMDQAKNCELIHYFENRAFWLLEIDRDEDPVKLSPYPKKSCL
jgi:hypothetical protein